MSAGSARQEVLGRVRAALGEARHTAPAPVPRDYARDRRVADPVGLFCERVADYRARVTRCAPEQAASAVEAALRGTERVVVARGFPDDLARRVWQRVQDPGVPAGLERVDAVLTTATVGIAVTGTIVLDHGPGQGRRALTLVPDRHVCVVRADQVVADVPAALALLDPLRPQTWVSGPSATSDIELSRVEGVHGPRALHVVVLG